MEEEGQDDAASVLRRHTGTAEDGVIEKGKRKI